MEQGFWTLALVLGVGGFFLCFVEEGAWSHRILYYSKLGNLLIKTFFLPNLCYMPVFMDKQLTPTLFDNNTIKENTLQIYFVKFNVNPNIFSHSLFPHTSNFA